MRGVLRRGGVVEIYLVGALFFTGADWICSKFELSILSGSFLIVHVSKACILIGIKPQVRLCISQQ